MGHASPFERKRGDGAVGSYTAARAEVATGAVPAPTHAAIPAVAAWTARRPPGHLRTSRFPMPSGARAADPTARPPLLADPRPMEAPVPLRIALLAEYYRPRLGGVEVFVSDLAERLAGAGHDVHVLTTTPAADDEQGGRIPTVDEGGQTGVTVERIDTWRVPSVGLPLSPALPARFEAALRRLAPDVVHAHASIASAGALAGGWAAHRLGLPGVLTIHSLLGQHAWLHRLFHGWTGWGNWPDLVAGPSRDVADDVARTIDRPAIVLPNGVDVSWWRATVPAALPGPGEALRLVAVQRLKGKKRGDALLDVLHRVGRRLPPGAAVALTVVGDGPRRGDLEAQARRLGVDVTFMGAVPRAEVRTALGRAHAFVSTCASEAFGIAAAEARAAGLPVLAFRTGALPALVPDGRCGILVDHDGGMERAIRRIATEAGLLARLTAESRAHPPPFDWTDVVGLHEDAYHAAVRAATASGPIA